MQLSRMAMESAVRHRDDGVFAVGLGGDERHPPRNYAYLFRYALDHGLRSLPHAGETGGPDSIRGALDELDPDRIGHGVRCLEAPDVVARLRDERVPLDVSPTSNVLTRVIERIDDHPLPRLIDEGLVVTLNADDPSMFHQPLSREYEVVRTVFGMNDDELATIARTGIEASFADDPTKRRIAEEVDAWARR
jgi:adenosine deaminase